MNHKLCYPGNSLLNGISEKGFSKNQQLTVKNFPVGISKKVLQEMENFVADKSGWIFVHAGTNGITNGINSLNSVKKMVKNVKKSSPNTKLVFSSILLSKATNINSHLKSYCQKKHLDFIDNQKLLKEHLRNRELHLKSAEIRSLLKIL